VFLGHFAVGLASKRVAPRSNLGALMAAPLFLDLLWPIGILTGIEHVRIVPGDTVVTPLDLHDYPYSHSLLMAVVWSVLFAVGYLALARDRRGTVVVGLGVFSHWILDYVTHRPDMPLYPGSTTYVGLGLWNSLVGTLVIESAMFAIGVWLYVTSTRPRNRVGSIAMWALLGFLVISYVTAVFGPPPPSVQMIGIAGLAGWLFVAWAWWIDRNREAIRG
jgi:membrane-bound metal-dependent hydrolase YbcI (DUF457 family)